MMTRHAWRVDPDRRVRRPPDDVLAIEERDLASFPDQPIPHRVARGLGCRGLASDVPDEPVPKPVHRSHEPWIVCRIGQRPPDLSHEAGEIRVEDERVWPQVFLELGARHGPGTVLDQHEKKIECLRRQVELFVVPEQSTRVGIEGEAIERVLHAASAVEGSGAVSLRFLLTRHSNGPRRQRFAQSQNHFKWLLPMRVGQPRGCALNPRARYRAAQQKAMSGGWGFDGSSLDGPGARANGGQTIIECVRYTILATDYDGTLARDGVVHENTITALERLRATGRRAILLTGRELTDILAIFPRPELFDRIVAENGALLYDPATCREQLLAEPVPLVLIDVLRSRQVQPLSVSRAILHTRVANERVVRAAIDELKLDVQVVLNKGSAMVLPRGIDKASGLVAVCDSMQIRLEDVVGIGDAENDLPLLMAAGLAVATSNALPEVKQIANLVTEGEDGDGVAEFVEQLVSGLEGSAPAT
jgi:hydroxymethylpyrimidine pyrophosphatase-like HAD family hydrolase